MKTFSQGIHPEYRKEQTENSSIVEAAVPARVIIPLHQHTGASCEPLVKVGDLVAEGQKIGESSKMISAAVHASISGKVAKIEKLPHPCGVRVLSIVIEGTQIADHGSRRACRLRPEAQPEGQAGIADRQDDIIAVVKEAGIVGLGGAAFPAHVKLSPPPGKKIDTILINGCECEPYITADHRIMLERADDVVAGAKLIAKATGATRIIIGIEDNKFDAIKVLRAEVRKQHAEWVTDGIDVETLETKYPQGGEKMLIKALLNREVPSSGLPVDVGAVVFNVGTAVAIFEAVKYGTPLIKRVVTVTGSGIKEPKNLLVRIGASFQELINQCGGFTEDAYKIIAGGPMMGVTQVELDVPVVKATSCILVLSKKEIKNEQIFPCIKCTRCIDHCPMFLLPTKLTALAKSGKFSDFEEWGGQDCLECGSCAYVCPAKIPIVQWIKYAKYKLRQLK